MAKVATQFGIAVTADFEENTWTFEMPENFKVWAGEFAIVDKPVYDELLEALKSSLNALKWYKKEAGFRHGNEAINKSELAIKKATE